MLVTPRFVFLHLHKSGGTFVNDALMRFIPGAQQIGYHLPREMIPPAFAQLPILGLVRNPWSYYVSWYSFQKARSQPNALYRITSDEGRLDFAATLRNLLRLGHDDELLSKVLTALPDSYTNRGLNLPSFVLRRIRATRLGFYSFLHDYMYGPDADGIIVGRMENLRTDLPRMLAQAGEPSSPELLRFIAEAAPLNTSDHADYREYYDAQSAGAVVTADKAVIQRYQYSFPA